MDYSTQGKQILRVKPLKSFTLTEVLVVLMIIGIWVLLAFHNPALKQSLEELNAAVCGLQAARN
jgi:prepilin-type N-terminal cleavage/methylation domain-containing protein